LLNRQSKAEYKINVVDQIFRRRVFGLVFRQRMPEGVKVVQYFDLSFDDRRLATKERNRLVGHPQGEGRFLLLKGPIRSPDR
jgi:hypothetical protein